jgi:hypothetical protein
MSLVHFTDSTEEVTFAVYSVDTNPANVAKKVGKILELDFTECDAPHDKYDEYVFQKDTLIVGANDFTEDLLGLLEYGVFLYVVNL